MTVSLTVLILTKNERLHIERCVSSVRGFARRVVIVDSFSTDGTPELAEELGCTVLQNPFRNYAAQFQWGLDNLPEQTDWILRMDADEWLDPVLVDSLRQIMTTADPDVTGIKVKLLNYFQKRPIRYGGRSLHLLRAWRWGTGRIEQRWMDEHITLSHGRCELADGWLNHENLKPLAEWISKHNSYAGREAIDALNTKYQLFSTGNQGSGRQEGGLSFKQRAYYLIGGNLAPLLFFIYRFVLRGGFLDGSAGYTYHFLQGYWYRTLVAAKVRELDEALGVCNCPDQRRQVIQSLTGQVLP